MPGKHAQVAYIMCIYIYECDVYICNDAYCLPSVAFPDLPTDCRLNVESSVFSDVRSSLRKRLRPSGPEAA